MIAICKHLCRGVDGKGIVRERYIHLPSFFSSFSSFWGDSPMKEMLPLFVPRQLYCSIHRRANVSGGGGAGLA